MKPMLTFYGDDFTGSTAVMEVLSFAGLPTMLFMEPPEPSVLNDYPDLKAIGVAGVARSKSPNWMTSHLPPVFEALKKLDAPVLHYKVCSTFDSSPETGSIGVATELGAALYGDDWVPLVVGAPAIRRYQTFGTLFAAEGQDIYRIDRHPVMSRHPVTPAHEADLGRHLSDQTDMKVGVVDLASMKAGKTDALIERLVADGARILAIDVLDEETLVEAGRAIWRDSATARFAVGSQGVEYALVAYWKACGLITEPSTPIELTPVEQLFAVSGSCSPTTAGQIAFAETHGFRIFDFDAATAVDPAALAKEVERAKSACLALLSQGHDVLATTVRGPSDPAMSRMLNAIEQSSTSARDANERLAQALGGLVADIRKSTGLPRIAIGGGDTSGHALSALNAEALSFVAPIAAGAPLCKLHTRASREIDGLEVTLKGGQMGSPDFFVKAKGGLIPQ